MITCSPLGRYGHLGNQMFQYASTMGIALKNNLDWTPPPADTWGEGFFLRSSIHECFDLDKGSPYVAPNVFIERVIGFDQDLYENCPDEIDIQGYLQSYKYFEEFSDDIRKAFTFQPWIEEEAFVPDDPFITLHVRRSDYLSLAGHLINLDMDYYLNALEYFDDSIGVLVMSDDTPWCMQKFNSDRFNFSTQSAYCDLYTMTKAVGNITANSSFSWWGGWLNQDSVKVAPSRWFGDNDSIGAPGIKTHNIHDIIPLDWNIV